MRLHYFDHSAVGMGLHLQFCSVKIKGKYKLGGVHIQECYDQCIGGVTPPRKRLCQNKLLSRAPFIASLI